MKTIFLVLALMFVGCADDQDDPCDPETGEECDDGRDTAANRPPRGAGVLPAGPCMHNGKPCVAVKEQELVFRSLPRYVYTTPTAAPVNAPEWDSFEGGLAAWMRVTVQKNATEATYLQINNETFIARSMPGWSCQKPKLGSAVCAGEGLGFQVIRCPAATLVDPKLYSNDFFGQTFPFVSNYAVVSKTPLNAPWMTLGVDSAGSALLKCHYSGDKYMTIRSVRRIFF